MLQNAIEWYISHELDISFLTWIKRQLEINMSLIRLISTEKYISIYHNQYDNRYGINIQIESDNVNK